MIRKLMYQIKYIVYFIVGTLFVTACEDFVEIDPPRTEIVSGEVFKNDQTAEAAVNAIYGMMTNSNTIFDGEFDVSTGVLSDELTSFSRRVDLIQFSTNTIDPNNATVLDKFWADPYQFCYQANAAIEALQSNNQVTDSLRNQLIGESLFFRAYFHFYLTNFFGPIPYVNSTDILLNNSLSRLGEEEVYANIINDLTEARPLLQEDYSFAEGEERIRINQPATAAFLARVYLYREDWAGAIEESTSVIENPLYSLDSLNGISLANNNESIFQLKPPPHPNNRTKYGDVFVINIGPPGQFSGFGPQVALSDNLVSSFEPDDARLANWVNTYTAGSSSWNYSFKYKNNLFDDPTGPEYFSLFRLAEQYLIRAEAQAHLGNIQAALKDLDVVRSRAQLPLLQDTNPGISQNGLLEAIYQERRIELFAEGHRWFDLIRTGRANEVLSPLKKGWQSTDVLLPVPAEEIFNNSNLLPQNLGY